MNNVIKKRPNFYKNIFIVLIALCGMNIFPKKMMSLAQERQREEQREGIRKVDLREIEATQASDLFTQSQAHVQIKRIRELIQIYFGDDQKKFKALPYYFNIISRMVTKEAELQDTHYVFYHASATMLAIMMDLFTQLYFELEHPEEKAVADETFKFLRFQSQSTDLAAREFVEKELRAHGLIDDKTDEMMAILLSVNLSLFGSVGSKTESTWLRFLDNRRSLESWQQKEFEAMMDRFGLPKKYITEIMALDNIFATTPEAMLLQIFIPKEIVDQLVYLAWIRGLPASDPIVEWIKEYQSSEAVPEFFEEKGKKKGQQRGALEHIAMSREKLAAIFKKEQEKNPIFKQFMEELKAGEFSTYAYLRAYCNKPSETPYINDNQGRILFTKEGLHNPSAGIKFYSYFSTPREKLEEYTIKLDALVDKLIAEKKGQKVETKPAPKPATKMTPSPKQAKSAGKPKPPTPVQKQKQAKSVK